jgi:glycosyltransferase involved in cell wall biosynthesis
MFVAQRKSHDPTVTAFVPPMDFVSRLRRRIRAERIARTFARYYSNRPAGCDKFSDDRSCYGGSATKNLPACDVINLHWIASFIDYRAFFEAVPEQVPVFWQLLDMNALTGGCHYDEECGRYITGCGACPQLGSTDSKDLSYRVWQRKQVVFSRLPPERVHIVAPNRWIAQAVRRSPLLGKFPVAIVPNGIDTDVFAPRDGQAARSAFGIPQDSTVVLFAAEAISLKRKGFALLMGALNELGRSKNLFLVSVGRGAPDIASDIPHSHLGHIDDDRQLSRIYSAADIYVIPSLQDNQPNTALEAMACGTPVVGFDVGGIPDMVRPGINGLLASAGDLVGLRAAIAELLQCSEKRSAMAIACRRIVMGEYTLAKQVRRYVELYSAALHTIFPNRALESGI